MIAEKRKATKVLYDLSLGQSVTIPNTNTIYFDSVSEYHCYQMLNRYFNHHAWDIGIHAKLITQSCAWKLDFCIAPREANLTQWNLLTTIAGRINNAIFTHPLTHLWVEFKGIQDANFIKKMGLIKCNHPEISKSIILCSGVDTAFGVFDRNSQKSCTQFIISMYNLEAVIKSVIAP
jgi:hypothetical protein